MNENGRSWFDEAGKRLCGRSARMAHHPFFAGDTRPPTPHSCYKPILPGSPAVIGNSLGFPYCLLGKDGNSKRKEKVKQNYVVKYHNSVDEK